MHTALL